MQGYVALHRKIIDSWIAEDPMALALWARILIEATHKKRKVMHRGELYDIEKGQLMFGLNKWSDKTGISREVIRKRIDMFESDGMITRQKHPHMSIITVCKWDSYQSNNTATTRLEHGENTATTRREQQYNNVNKVNNVNNVNKSNGGKPPEKRKRFTPPTIQEASDYFFERGASQKEAQKFIDFYESKGWYVGKNKMKDWKAAVRNWLRTDDKVQKGKSANNSDYYESLANKEFK